MEKLRGNRKFKGSKKDPWAVENRHITNFNKSELLLYKVALILYDKTEEHGLYINETAYDMWDDLLEHMCALHKRSEFGIGLSDFWLLVERLHELSEEELIAHLRFKKLERILQ